VWAFGGAGGGFAMVRRCRFTPVEARVESAWFQRLQLRYEEPLSTFAFIFNPVIEARVESSWFHRLKLRYEEPLSNFAINFNLRHYSMDYHLQHRGTSFVTW